MLGADYRSVRQILGIGKDGEPVNYIVKIDKDLNQIIVTYDGSEDEEFRSLMHRIISLGAEMNMIAETR